MMMFDFQIGSGREIYHFKLCDSEKRSMKTDSPDMTKKEHLLREPEVKYLGHPRRPALLHFNARSGLLNNK